MESSFISFVKKPYLLYFFIFVSGSLCSVYFLPFIASYHLLLIFAVILWFFFFVACRCHSLQLLTNVIFTGIVMYWWYHVVLYWCNDIICRHVFS